MQEPTIEQVKALNGRIFAMLTPEELEVFRFYRDRGRKYGVAISVSSDVFQAELASATPKHAEEILRRTNSKIAVDVRKESGKHAIDR